MEIEFKMNKICTKCKIEQEENQFPLHARYRGGRTTWCRQCLRERTIQWYINNPEKRRASESRRNKRNPKVRQNSKFKQRYGISLENFNEISTKQNDRCLICDKHKSDNKLGKLFVDHCHKSGKVRGLICDNCNRGLGHFKDNAKFY